MAPGGSSPIYAPGFTSGGMAQTTPAGPGQGAGYSPTTPGYLAASSPGYGPPGGGRMTRPAGTPGYLGARAGPGAYGGGAPYGLQAGGRAPGHQFNPAGGPSGSPAYRAPATGRSPAYAPGNAAYSPTQPHYGAPDAYPAGGAPGQGGAKRDASSSSDNG